jgi:hypothetical protein
MLCFSPLNTLMWKKKDPDLDPDPDPYPWLMNSETCGSGSGSGAGFPTLHSGPSSRVQFYFSLPVQAIKKEGFPILVKDDIQDRPPRYIFCSLYRPSRRSCWTREAARNPAAGERAAATQTPRWRSSDKSMIDESITILLGSIFYLLTVII